MKKDILFANIGSIILSVLLIFSTINIALKYVFPRPVDSSSLILITIALMMVVFTKHINPLKEILQKNQYERIKRK